MLQVLLCSVQCYSIDLHRLHLRLGMHQIEQFPSYTQTTARTTHIELENVVEWKEKSGRTVTVFTHEEVFRLPNTAVHLMVKLTRNE